MEMDFLNHKPAYLEAKVGSYAVFNCPLDFPQEIEIPYILHWNKEVTKKYCRSADARNADMHSAQAQVFDINHS